MYGPGQELPTWHPLRSPGRVDNYALSALGYAGPRRPGTGPGTRQDEPGRRGGLFYLMGCGHRSLPGHSVCERGCLKAPAYKPPFTPHPEWTPYLRRAAREKTWKALPRA